MEIGGPEYREAVLLLAPVLNNKQNKKPTYIHKKWLIIIILLEYRIQQGDYQVGEVWLDHTDNITQREDNYGIAVGHTTKILEIEYLSTKYVQ